MIHSTPSLNVGVDLRLGGFSSLVEALEYASKGSTGLNFYSGFGELQYVLPYSKLKSEAQEVALNLLGLNLEPGTCVGLVADTSPEFIILFYACQYAGLLPCILPSRAIYGQKKEYLSQLLKMLESCGAGVLFVSSAFLSVVSEECFGDVILFDFTSLKNVHKRGVNSGFQVCKYAYVQFSSGSTSFPKGVLIGQKAVSANATEIVRHGMAIREGDRAFSWLPFYHDMGFVGFFIAAVFSQCSVDYISPISFSKRPGLWLKLISRNSSTITYAPAFAYALAAQRFVSTDYVDLSSLRIAGVGGDFIKRCFLNEFSKKMLRFGFDDAAWLPSYGMAEAVLAISIGRLGAGLNIQSKVGRHGVERDFIGCGRLLNNNDLFVRDDFGRNILDGDVGSVFYKGLSLADGYFFDGKLNPISVCADGFFDTGDLGFVLGDELFIVGRKKDLIKIRGVGYWPGDIEYELECKFFLKSGDVVAFSVGPNDGEEFVVVLIQAGAVLIDDAVVQRKSMQMHLQSLFGFSPEVLFVPSKTFPLTTSGKVARSIVRDNYILGSYR